MFDQVQHPSGTQSCSAGARRIDAIVGAHAI